MTPDQWERVRQVFDEALDHEPASRAEFLDGACRGDDELRAEVEQLLAEDEATGGFLNSAIAAVRLPRNGGW